MSRSTISASTILTVLLLIAAPVRAQNDLPATAKESFDRGVTLFNKNDYSGALAEFLAAYEAKPHYSVLYNIAQCLVMTDDHAKALESYTKYLTQGADYISDERREAVESEIARLEDLLCRLTMDVSPEGVLVTVDGVEVGTSPFEDGIFLDPGEHVLQFEKKGFSTYKTSLVLRRDEDKTLEIQLEQEQESGEDEVEPEAEKQHSHAMFWALLGTTAALGVSTGVLGGITLKKSKDFANYRESEEDEWKPLQEDGKKLALATDILIGTTAAAAMAMIIVGIVSFRKGEREKHAALTPVLFGSGAGIVLTGEF